MKKSAFLFGSSIFADKNIHNLNATENDVIELREVLSNPDIGEFKTEFAINKPLNALQLSLIEFLNRQSKDDIVLVYYTGHGLLDRKQDLHLALKETNHENPEVGSIHAEWLREKLSECRSIRKVLILDCCHSGGIVTEGTAKKSNVVRAINDKTFHQEQGYGVYVLASSEMTRASFEIGDSSLFTGKIIEGLKSGAAAPNKKYISVSDLDDYLFDQLSDSIFHQVPQTSVFQKSGELYLAKNKYYVPPIPEKILSKLKHNNPAYRIQAVRQVASRALTSKSPSKINEAKDVLKARISTHAEKAEDSKLVYDTIVSAIEELDDKLQMLGGQNRSFISPVIEYAKSTNGKLALLLIALIVGSMAIASIYKEEILFSYARYTNDLELLREISESDSPNAQNAREVYLEEKAKIDAVIAAENIQEEPNTDVTKGNLFGGDEPEIQIQISPAEPIETLDGKGNKTDPVSGEFPEIQKAGGASHDHNKDKQSAASKAPEQVVDLEVSNPLDQTKDHETGLPTKPIAPEELLKESEIETSNLTSPKPNVAEKKSSLIVQEGVNCPLLSAIPNGLFMMGAVSEERFKKNRKKPLPLAHPVKISKPFAMGVYEVTREDWKLCMENEGCGDRWPPGTKDGGKLPVTRISWDDAKQYTNWMSQRTGKKYRLPTEAEWEYAARAFSTTDYALGNEISTSQANFRSAQSRSPKEVGNYLRNNFGLYDMIGNVHEWTEDCAHDDFFNAPINGSAWKQEENGNCRSRVFRGGSFNNYQDSITLNSRLSVDKDGLTYTDLGLRVVRELTQQEATELNTIFLNKKIDREYLEHHDDLKDRFIVWNYQLILKKSNFYSGKVDGYFGHKTIRSLKAFQKAKGMQVNAKISDSILAEMQDLTQYKNH